MSKPKLSTFNTFFDCNYSAAIVSVRGYNRGYNIAIIFKNKLICESDYFYQNSENIVAKVELGCYSASIEAVKKLCCKRFR